MVRKALLKIWVEEPVGRPKASDQEVSLASLGDPAQACIHHSPTQAITLRFEGGPNRFHGFARSNAWDVLHNDEARLAPRDDLGISNREDCAPTILGSLAGLREILTRRPADDDIRSEAGNFLGYGNVGEIPFENRMLEVSAIDRTNPVVTLRPDKNRSCSIRAYCRPAGQPLSHASPSEAVRAASASAPDAAPGRSCRGPSLAARTLRSRENPFNTKAFRYSLIAVRHEVPAHSRPRCQTNTHHSLFYGCNADEI